MVGWYLWLDGCGFEQALGVGELWELVSWWGRPGALQSMGLQRVRHDWATKRNSLIFIPDTFSLEEEGFLSLFYLHQKCQGVGAGGAGWVLLTCKVNLIMRAEWAKGYIRMQRFLPWLPFVCYSDPYYPKCVLSCQSAGFFFPLSACGTLLWTRPVISCHLPPFLFSYLATCLL